ncbi:MAG: hemolysin III family protein [Gemmataceae bacterium]|nr:hemolysin III family protein [Gemmataceae bacterium]
MGLRDPLSSASHLLTAAWAAYATLILLRLTPAGAGRRAAVAVFGLSMVLLYLASGTFHGVPYTRDANPDEFRLFQKLDQSAIFVLIAGTNTPIIVTLLAGARRRWFLRLMWAVAATGVGCLWLLPKAPHWVTVGNYVLMGWLGIVPGWHYVRVLGGVRPMLWAAAGSVLYTAGAVCEVVEWPVLLDYPVRVGYHEVLHLFDVAGTVAFFLFIARYVVPFEPGAEPKSAVFPERAALTRPAVPVRCSTARRLRGNVP